MRRRYRLNVHPHGDKYKNCQEIVKCYTNTKMEPFLFPLALLPSPKEQIEGGRC